MNLFACLFVCCICIPRSAQWAQGDHRHIKLKRQLTKWGFHLFVKEILWLVTLQAFCWLPCIYWVSFKLRSDFTQESSRLTSLSLIIMKFACLLKTMSQLLFFSFITSSLDVTGAGNDVERGGEISDSHGQRRETWTDSRSEWAWVHLSGCDRWPSARGDIDNFLKLGTRGSDAWGWALEIKDLDWHLPFALPFV